MPSLYNEYEMLDQSEGNELSREIIAWIDPLIKKYASRGYPLREIESVIVNDIHLAFCEELLRRSFIIAKAKRVAAKEKARNDLIANLNMLEEIVDETGITLGELFDELA